MSKVLGFCANGWQEDVLNFKDAYVLIESDTSDTTLKLQFDKSSKNQGLFLTKMNFAKVISFMLNSNLCDVLVVVTDTDDNICGFRFYMDTEDLPTSLMKIND